MNPKEFRKNGENVETNNHNLCDSIQDPWRTSFCAQVDFSSHIFHSFLIVYDRLRDRFSNLSLIFI